MSQTEVWTRSTSVQQHSTQSILIRAIVKLGETKAIPKWDLFLKQFGADALRAYEHTQTPQSPACRIFQTIPEEEEDFFPSAGARGDVDILVQKLCVETATWHHEPTDRSDWWFMSNSNLDSTLSNYWFHIPLQYQGSQAGPTQKERIITENREIRRYARRRQNLSRP